MSRQKELERWLEGRPAIIRETATKLLPWKVYRLKTTGQLARVQAYAEDGTVRCLCWRDELGPEFASLTAVSVYGLSPDDLEEVAA